MSNTLISSLASKKNKVRNHALSVYIGNLDERVTEEILWELFTQAGRVRSVRIPKAKSSATNRYGFVEFQMEASVNYAVQVFNTVPLYGKPIRVNPATTSGSAAKKSIGAILFIGNLAVDVNEKLLYDTFSSFGTIAQVPSISYDSDGKSKGFAFIGFDSFTASDNAIKYMSGQMMCNKPLKVQYALRKGGNGDRHGSEAERLLAAKIELKKEQERQREQQMNPEGMNGGPPEGGANGVVLPLQHAMPGMMNPYAPGMMQVAPPMMRAAPPMMQAVPPMMQAAPPMMQAAPHQGIPGMMPPGMYARVPPLGAQVAMNTVVPPILAPNP